MPKWDDPDWYVEYEEMVALARRDDDTDDDQEAEWSVWRVRAQRIHDDILERIALAHDACQLRKAKPDQSWEDIAAEIGWKRSIPLLKAACEWLDQIEPEKLKVLPLCGKRPAG